MDEKEKTIGPVVTGKTREREKGELRKLGETLLPEDIKEGIVRDILIPLAKKAVTGIVQTLLYPDKPLGGEYRDYSSSSKPAYRRYYDEEDRPSRARASTVLREIIFDERGDAEVVLYRMKKLLDEYGNVSLLEYYDLAGQRTRPGDKYYGWTSLNGAYVRMAEDGYMIKLPRPLELNR